MAVKNSTSTTQTQRDAERIEKVNLEKVALKIGNNFPLDIWEVSALLCISKRTVQDIVLKGELETIKLGRRVLFSGKVVSQYLESLETKGGVVA